MYGFDLLNNQLTKIGLNYNLDPFINCGVSVVSLAEPEVCNRLHGGLIMSALSDLWGATFVII